MSNIYAIVNNNTIIATGRAKALWPQMSFADSGPREDWLFEQGAQPIRYDPPYDPDTHQLQPSAPYLLDGVVYAREAVDRPPPEPVGPDYEGFYLSLKGTRLYGSLIAPLVFDDVSVAIKGCFTVIIASLIDMRIGSTLAGPGEADPSLQAALVNFIAIAGPSLDEEAMAELGDLMVRFGLAPLYSLGGVEP